MTLLELDNLRLWLDDRQLLDVSASIGPGEVLTIMGPSGIGKSSLLALIAGFLSPDFRHDGAVRLGGRPILDLPPERRGIGLLMQQPWLFPHMSVAGNLRFGLPRARRYDAARLVAEALESAGLAGCEDADVATLSGGQAARVAVLRLLLSEPSAVLLDEPFSSLDAGLRQSFRQFVFARLRQAGLPAILVTHDPGDAEAAGGRVLVLSGDGLAG